MKEMVGVIGKGWSKRGGWAMDSLIALLPLECVPTEEPETGNKTL